MNCSFSIFILVNLLGCPRFTFRPIEMSPFGQQNRHIANTLAERSGFLYPATSEQD